MNFFEIEDKVMEKYPVTEEESRCQMIKDFMKKVRDSYREKLKKGIPVNEPGKQENIQPAQ